MKSTARTGAAMINGQLVGEPNPADWAWLIPSSNSAVLDPSRIPPSRTRRNSLSMARLSMASNKSLPTPCFQEVWPTS